MNHDKRLSMLVSSAQNLTDKIALFGSSVNRTEYNDIDVLIFADKKEVGFIRKNLENNKQLHPIYIEKKICSYSSIRDIKDEEQPNNNKTIHVSFVPKNKKEYEKAALWKLNRNAMKFLIG